MSETPRRAAYQHGNAKTKHDIVTCVIKFFQELKEELKQEKYVEVFDKLGKCSARKLTEQACGLSKNVLAKYLKKESEDFVPRKKRCDNKLTVSIY